MKIAKKFIELKQKNEIALIVYMTIGFPTIEKSIENIKIIADAGADIIEIGVPFSDPLADGPTIQYASQIALKNSVTLKVILDNLQKVKVEKPLVLMSYLNPLLSYGKKTLFKDIRKTGITGLIIPDLPPEESREWKPLSKKYNIDMIFLLSTTTETKRMKNIVKNSEGFIYCLSLTGTTGIKNNLPYENIKKFLNKVRKHTHKPLALGFGISQTKHIKKVRNYVDGVIMGSKIINHVKENNNLFDLIYKYKKATIGGKNVNCNA